MQSKAISISPLQCLILWYASASLIYAVVYVVFWGLTLPEVLPGLWTAVVCGALANVFIQFFNVKAASIDKGEVSLTAPLQAMTPGLITILALLLAEYPSTLGVAGIALMASGSYVLLFEKTPNRWYEYFAPLKRLVLLLQMEHLSKTERNKTIVVMLALASACLGTIGLLFDGLYTRRSITMQGLVLAAMGLTAFLTIAYAACYVIFPDAQPEQKFAKHLQWKTLVPILAMGILWVVHVLAIWPAFNQTLVAYTGTLKRFSVLISVVLGFLIFHEQDFKKRFWAASLIIAGAILIATDDLPARLATKIEGLGL